MVSTTVAVLLFTAVAAGLIIPAILYSNQIVRWIRIRNYQWEVTTGIFFFNKIEIFIFDSFVFLTLAIFFLACALYLPTHIRTVAERTVYYFSGPTPSGLSAGLSSKIASAGHAAADGMHYVRDAMNGASASVVAAGADAAAAVSGVVHELPNGA